MVATRRTAPTVVDTEMPDPELALKKKPVRKATARTAAKAAPAAKAKTSRAKKAEEAPVEPVSEAVEEAPKPRGTRGRPKRTVEVAPEPEPQAEPEKPVKPAKATRATRAGSVRGKAPVISAEEAPELRAPKAAKPARQTRAASSKAPPLSPKKVTQVVKPQTRTANAKASDAKLAAKAATTGSVRSRVATRGRKVSDENAEVPALAQPEEADDSVVVVSSTPVKKPATRRQAARKQEVEESEISMSTQDTTPTASPAPSRDDDIEDEPEEVEEPSADFSTPEKAEQAVNEDSDDELCGPKTPMRRGSPGAEARYHSSAQRTIRKYNDEQRVQTPARRLAVLGSQRGTPQTQKPYCKPAPPSSEVRPMTVARGGNRAFVFRDLRDGAPSLPPREQPHGSIAEEEDVSFIPDDNIIEMDNEEYAQMTTPRAPAPVQLASPPTSSTDIEEQNDEVGTFNPVQDDEHSADASVTDPVDYAAPEDPDATTLNEEIEEETELDAPATECEIDSFETEDTVIINRPEHVDMADASISTANDESELSVIHNESAASSTPETMVWENVQPEQTIAVNFDLHLHEARALPEPEPTEVLNIASTLDAHLDREHDHQDAAAGADEEAMVRAGTIADDQADEQSHSISGANTPVQIPAVDLNDYFDMTALAEPTQAIDCAAQPGESVDIEMQDAPLIELSTDVGHVDTNATQATVTADEVDATEGQDLGISGDSDQHDSSAIEDDDDGDVAATQLDDEQDIPHYAHSTFAFDARRKSLPATSMFTPVKAGTRPSTSDGVNMPRVANPFGQAWWSRSRAGSFAATPGATPHKSRRSTAHGQMMAPVLDSTSKATTPATKERYPVLAPRRNQVDHTKSAAPIRFRDVTDKAETRRQTFHRAISGKTQEPPTPVKATTLVATTPAQKPKECYPVLGLQTGQVDHSQTVAPPARFQDPVAKGKDRRKTFHKAVAGKTRPPPSPVKLSTPAKAATPVARPKERYLVLGSRTNFVDHAQTVAPSARFQDPDTKPSTRRQTFHRAISGKVADKQDEVEHTPVKSPVAVETTPKAQRTPTERFPRLRPRSDYQEHAKTVSVPRFATPAKTPLKHPGTTQKLSSMRKAALRNSAATPVKTPLKAPAMTPGQEPMTPHPAAPLRGVVALVEVYTLEGASASSPFTALLHRLGAKTTRTWTDRVTHVIFKDGSPTTLQRVRLHNKDVAASGKGVQILCVNSRWVSDCDTAGTRVEESDEAYAVDVEEVPRGGKRRRKSMEPSALVNLGGNVVRNRQSSLGRNSLGRSSMRISESPAKKAKLEAEDDATPGAGVEDKENSDDEPGTPAWIAEPDKLVQMTAPMKRVKKLELQGKQSRRLTFWEGGN